MKKKLKNASLPLMVLLATTFTTSAFAGTVSYISPKHVFGLDDVMCDDNVFGQNCLSSEEITYQKDGQLYYAIDSAYGFSVTDFTPPVEVPMDNSYDNGLIRTVTDENGNFTGVKIVSQVTPKYKVGALKGKWAAGLGGNSVKAGTEHYLVMDHILNAEWMPPLVEVQFDPTTGEALNVGDFSTVLKDDGKILFRWGNLEKAPCPVRLYTTIPLPETWKQPGANYTVTSAKLVVKHLITNSPNDQIRPEDFENEDATGILPRFTEDAEGRWYSAVDAYEGDGDFIPAGTLLKDNVAISYDRNGDGINEYVDYKTNAWYTSLDRDPFGGSNPRYRLKSSKYGQDVPGVEIPQYPVGTPTTTTLDLLSIVDDDGNPILAQSANWYDYLDINPVKFDEIDDDFTADGSPLTPDFDLMLYVKGEYKGTEIYDATLIVEYEDPEITDPPPADEVDVNVINLEVNSKSNRIRQGETIEILTTLQNDLPGFASGVLNLEVRAGETLVDSFSTNFTTTDDSSPTSIPNYWTAPMERFDVTFRATAVVDGDIDETDNFASTEPRPVR